MSKQVFNVVQNQKTNAETTAIQMAPKGNRIMHVFATATAGAFSVTWALKGSTDPTIADTLWANIAGGVLTDTTPSDYSPLPDPWPYMKVVVSGITGTGTAFNMNMTY